MFLLTNKKNSLNYLQYPLFSGPLVFYKDQKRERSLAETHLVSVNPVLCSKFSSVFESDNNVIKERVHVIWIQSSR